MSDWRREMRPTKPSGDPAPVVDHFENERRVEEAAPATAALERLQDLVDLGYRLVDVEANGDLLLVTLSRDGLCAVVALEAAETRSVLEGIVG